MEKSPLAILLDVRLSVLEVARFDCAPARYRVTVRLESGRTAVAICSAPGLVDPSRFQAALLRAGVSVSLPETLTWRRLVGTAPVRAIGVPSRG